MKRSSAGDQVGAVTRTKRFTYAACIGFKMVAIYLPQVLCLKIKTKHFAIKISMLCDLYKFLNCVGGFLYM